MGPGECNSFTLTLLACLTVTPCVPTILTPAVLAFLLLYNLWFEHHSGNSPINQVYTVTVGALGGLVGETPQCLWTMQGGDLAIVQQEAIQGSVKVRRTVLNM